eukprot:1454931-Ditylum_brightwellii.AAC.1
MASKLTPGSWVLFNSTGDAAEPIWIGRTIANPEWGSKCTWQKNLKGIKNIDGVLIGCGTYVLYVQFYTKKENGVLEYLVKG